MSDKTIFLTGATGYIGASVVQTLLALPNPPKQITALIRSETKAQHSDEPNHIKAIIEGSKEKLEKTGTPVYFIHTSGSAITMDNARGLKTSDEVISPPYNAIDTIPDTAFHRDVDLIVLEADKKGYVIAYIAIPPTIFGLGKGPLYDTGFAHNSSIQIPFMIRAALARKQPGVVGKGVNSWAYTYLGDVARLFAILYEKIGTIGHGHDGYYFTDGGEYNMNELVEAIGEVLSSKGLVASTETTSFTDEEIKTYFFGSEFMGTNNHIIAQHSAQIGWKSTVKGKDEFLKYVREETARLASK
ncbi:hypothetical protein TREMEDRAFT_25118 [Tremella mesenterica DSM 1558]|uniref:uncharacterized protein n=1 Tax=Tremella mesenterica (strain ATCC 24925 / CBS 8224 / DSM 1558 / NBRC 9311 / NRRL Y-6157 / RJB 2259-6 / UBC 559-6) TaxID=578456 RepID=UPI0003F49C62|nr:uncharacterized protein TREMEDRAFT_25118 [Tremella mesenterica DSM 1558]EIW73283.1 hypothetical protein TREMEDRAFT_25118 [Tremella mesenterica DSM 1558]